MPTVGLIGVQGYAPVHLRELDRLASLGKARLVACADVLPPANAEAAVISRLGADFFTDWRQMLERTTGLDVVVVAAPPHLHSEMCLFAAELGVHVLVEKPPVVTVEDFQRLSTAIADSGVLCQVGFQSLGSGALDRLREVALGRGEAPSRLVGWGQWQRDRGYWSRSKWAGKEALGRRPVRDGVLSNPFAHAVMNCLVVMGADDGNGVRCVEVERYRANPIEVEDTACTRVTLADGRVFSVAVTLCAERAEPPGLYLDAPSGEATWKYEADAVEFSTGARSWKETFRRRSLLEELLTVAGGRSGELRLSCPLERTRPFVEFVEAVHRAPVRDIAPEHVRWEEGGGSDRAALVGIGPAIEQARLTGRLFSEIGAPWATS